MGTNSEVVSASLDSERYEYVDENELSPTALLKAKVDELMNNEETPYKYTPAKYLKESRKSGLIVMLSGALILVLSMILSGYLMIATTMTGMEFAIVFLVMWLTGSAVTYYGFRTYSKWNDILYWRSEKNLEEREE